MQRTNTIRLSPRRGDELQAQNSNQLCGKASGTTLTFTLSPTFTPAFICISLSIRRKNFFARGTIKLSLKRARFRVPFTRCPFRPRHNGRGGIFQTSAGLKGTSTASSLWPGQYFGGERFLHSGGFVKRLVVASVTLATGRRS